MDADLLAFPSHDARGGRLVSLQTQANVPFSIRRVYYIERSDGAAVHGRHAHLRGEEVIVCLRGTCIATLDDGHSTRRFTLDDPGRGLYVGPLLWEEFDLSTGSLLLALASTLYDRADYIDDYDAFLEIVRTGEYRASR